MTKQKRYYKENEFVWSINLKKEVKIKSINKDDLTAIVLEKTDEGLKEHVFKLWEIDTLKYSAKEKLLNSKKRTNTTNNKVKVFFSKLRDDAVIPSKRDEDAGFDIYTSVKPQLVDGKVIHEIYCPVHKTTLVPTGIAMALPKTHYFNTKHERGSTGKIGMSVQAGVIDSGYRGEIFIAIVPLHKDVLITNQVSETVVQENVILYPYSKAICQGTIELVPQVEIEEISFEELQTIKSERGQGALGSSNK